MAVCGIGMPSGWRNSAVTAKPGLGGGLQEIGPVTGRQCVATQRDRTHQHQQKRREGAVPLKFAASFRVGVGFCHARKG
jgi:hypothetical protein